MPDSPIAETLRSLEESCFYKRFSRAFFTATGYRIGVDSLPNICEENVDGLGAGVCAPLMFRGKKLAQLCYSYEAGDEPSEEVAEAALTLLSSAVPELERRLGALILAKERVMPRNVVRAKEWIARNLSEDLSLAVVADQLGVNRFTLCRQFRAAGEQTLTEYIASARVEEVKIQLRSTSKPITEIAYEVGFRSLSQFNRAFARLEGVTPSQFRKSDGKAKVLSSTKKGGTSHKKIRARNGSLRKPSGWHLDFSI